jgi:hypothetical protein
METPLVFKMQLQLSQIATLSEKLSSGQFMEELLNLPEHA